MFDGRRIRFECEDLPATECKEAKTLSVMGSNIHHQPITNFGQKQIHNKQDLIKVRTARTRKATELSVGTNTEGLTEMLLAPHQKRL
jgi:hypothetical protein